MNLLARDLLHGGAHDTTICPFSLGGEAQCQTVSTDRRVHDLEGECKDMKVRKRFRFETNQFFFEKFAT
jgi:hypothetical protein